MMAKQYKAVQSVGQWQKGDVIGDLPQIQVEQLLKAGAIREVVQDTPSKTNIEPKEANAK